MSCIIRLSFDGQNDTVSQILDKVRELLFEREFRYRDSIVHLEN